MKALLISCYDDYELRLKYVEKILKERGYETYFVFSDFDHIQKVRTTYQLSNVILVHVPTYKKNISLKRIMSHIVFSYKIKRCLRYERPSLVYAIIPPNSLCKILYSYKKMYNSAKIIIDIYDLWPESFPFNINNNFFMHLWSDLRNDFLSRFDFVVLECQLYKKILKKFLPDGRNGVLYICKNIDKKELGKIEGEYINFCYLGSINHIIDIDYIINFLNLVKQKRKILFHIIGEGERKEELLKKLDYNSINYQFYGCIFDDKRKKEIMCQCQYAINIYKSSTAIGLTMKSVDYFKLGIPVISKNIHDTGNLIMQFGAGYNLNSENIDLVINQIAENTSEQILSMMEKSYELFINYFSEDSFERNLNGYLDIIL